MDWETWAAKVHQDGGNYFFCGKIAKPVTSRENTLPISIWQVFKFQRTKAQLAKQRRLLSDWSVQSGISCEFIRIAGRRLPASWHIDGWISSFKFHVCWCDHDTVWVKIAGFVTTLVTVLILCEKLFNVKKMSVRLHETWEMRSKMSLPGIFIYRGRGLYREPIY